MGLKLRLNLFHQQDSEPVFRAYQQFYAKRGQHLISEGEDQCEFVLRTREHGWTILELDAGWEWIVRREAQLYVSKVLNCVGFLIFVYDGDYWGYEFFRNGQPLDQFVQEEQPDDGTSWFPGQNSSGNPQVIADILNLQKEDLASYLIRDPLWARWEIDPDSDPAELEREQRKAEKRRLNIPARPGDQFDRFDECAVLDFLRFLGVRIDLVNRYVTMHAPVWRKFWIEGQNTYASHARLYRC